VNIGAGGQKMPEARKQIAKDIWLKKELETTSNS